MPETYLLTGSNLGERNLQLHEAKKRIGERIGEIRRVSDIYESAPWGKTNQPAFLNQVLLVNTSLTATELLAQLKMIESAMGRSQRAKWQEREIDLDILFYGDQITDTPELKIPHPEIANRLFTLIPLIQLSPDLIHPKTGESLSSMRAATSDTGWVKKWVPNNA
jgi:2-amino-4-hydroxy-6-hydroxymethyldihydropteridine diphosphokinase